METKDEPREGAIAQGQHRDNSIAAGNDLGRLVERIWSVRWPVVIALLIFSLCYWVLALMLAPSDVASHTWKSQVQFTFSGIDQGTYPDGTSFTAADLISPVVLQRVHAQFDIQQYELDLEAFSRLFSVGPHAPRREETITQYARRLDSDLSGAEVQVLEADFLARLQRITRGQAVISLTTSHSELPAREILTAIPRIWAEYVRDEHGFFESDIPLYTAEVVERSRVDQMGYLLGYDMIRHQFQRLRENLDQLEKQPNSGQVRDPESRLRLGDIRALAGELERFVLETTLSPSLAAGYTQEPELTAWFFENRIKNFERRRDLMKTRAERVDAVLDDYLAQRQYRDPAADLDMDDAPPGTGGGFLDRLVQLGASRGDVAFRQDLSRDSLEYTLNAAELSAEVSRLGSLLDVIRGDEADSLSGPASTGLGPEPGASLDDQIESLLDSLRNLFAATQRIAARMDALRHGTGESIYNIVEVSEEPTTAAVVLTEANLARYLLGLLIVLLAAVPGFLALALVFRRRN